MNRIFHARDYFTVDDGTDVSPFLNATDSQSDVPWGALGDMSIASGRIGPKVRSCVHFHPVVTVVIYVIGGELTIRMKDASVVEPPYDLPLKVGQAVLLEPRTLVQLRNDGDAPAEVLYIVSPQYVFEKENKEVRYDDAIVVAKTWKELVETGYNVPALKLTSDQRRANRDESMRRLAVRKGRGRGENMEKNLMAGQAEAYDKILTANLQRALDFVKFAEAKNAALLALASGWVLAILNLYNGQKTIPSQFTLTLKLALVMALGAALLAMFSFSPRLNLPTFLGGQRAGPHARNLLYFGDIRTLPIESSQEELHARYWPEDANKPFRDEYFNDLAVQIHVNSDIAVLKMRLFRVGLMLIALAAFSLLISAIFLFL
jgi:hypothetical protein